MSRWKGAGHTILCSTAISESKCKSRSSRRRTILGAFCWIAGLEFFLAEAIAAAGWPGYSYRDVDISYLGGTSCPGAVPPSVPSADPGSVLDLCSPRHLWLNGGFVLMGALHLAGVALTWRAWPPTWRARLGLISLGCGATGALMLGFAPVSARPLSLHLAAAAVALVMGNAGVLLMGLAVLRRAPVFAAISLAAGVAGFLGLLFYSIGVYSLLGRGGMERVAAYAVIGWFALAGAAVLAGALKRETGVTPR